MRSRFLRWFAVGAILALPVMAHAQEATLIGTVSDATGGALPGVAVTAVHEASGNSFETVTDAEGGYRLPMRVGLYELTATLAGFGTVTQAVTLLVGQEAVVNVQMAVGGVQETVTVTGEAPLLDLTQSSLGGNIDPRQLQELPVNGRNWMDLVMLAPGSRTNAILDLPVDSGGTQARGDYQINLDGQQVTQLNTFATLAGQPRFSRDSIAEFEFLPSRFDATQSRSAGVQVNAITKSGTNSFSGSFSGYFRDDSMNAADFVAERVLPAQDQQISATFGGPIRPDRLHFFAHHEYEREPQTFFYTTPYPSFNQDLRSTRTEQKGGVRLDAQFSARTRLTGRTVYWLYDAPHYPPASGGATKTPNEAYGLNRDVTQSLATLTQVRGTRAVNELRVGYFRYNWETDHDSFPNPLARTTSRYPSGFGGPRVQLPGIRIGGSLFPLGQTESVLNIRDGFTYSSARHTVRLGGEYLYKRAPTFWCVACEGRLDATDGPVPANLESLFPDLFDVSTWNLDALSAQSISWRQSFSRGELNEVLDPRHTFGVWIQDDWTLSPRLTLNLGLRYDLQLKAFANDREILPFLPGNRPNDRNNVGPRTGLAFTLNDQTVIRGGYGIYFGTVTGPHPTSISEQSIIPLILNDGRPDFASNPYNGPRPTFEAMLPLLCTSDRPPGCIQRELVSSGLYSPSSTIPYSHQAGIGLQRQLGATTAIQVDYGYTGVRNNVTVTDPNMNVTYDPVTGVNYDWRIVERRVFPEWGIVTMRFNGNRSNLHSLQTAFTKRMSDGWQLSGTYTLSGLWDAFQQPRSGVNVVPFQVAPDLVEYGLGVTDQRHRAVFNGIWQLPYDMQLSGLYFFGSGQRLATEWGVDLRRLGRGSEDRQRPDGTIVPRNNFVGDPLHRVDLRLQKQIPLGGRVGIDGILELFNVFNHANFGSYTTSEVSSRNGQPRQNTNASYLPRTVQLGFRLTF